VAARRRREAAASAVSTPPPRSRSRRGETSPRDVVLADAFRRWRESPPSPAPAPELRQHLPSLCADACPAPPSQSHPLALSCLARAAAARQPRSTLRRAVRVWRERCFAAARARRSAARRARSAALRRALGQWRRRARWQAGWQRRWRCRADRCGGERCVHLPCMRTLELRAVFLEAREEPRVDAELTRPPPPLALPLSLHPSPPCSGGQRRGGRRVPPPPHPVGGALCLVEGGRECEMTARAAPLRHGPAALVAFIFSLGLAFGASAAWPLPHWRCVCGSFPLVLCTRQNGLLRLAGLALTRRGSIKRHPTHSHRSIRITDT